jgi:hypothetical protein
VARLTGTSPGEEAEGDGFDEALEQLLRGETPTAPGERGEDAEPGEPGPDSGR